MRQRFHSADLDFLPDVPILAEMVAVEVAQSAHRLVHGAGCQLPLDLKVKHEVKDLIGVEPRRCLARKMAVKLTNPVEVDVLRALSESIELDKAFEFTIPGSEGDVVFVVSYIFFIASKDDVSPHLFQTSSALRKHGSPRSGSVQQDVDRKREDGFWFASLWRD